MEGCPHGIIFPLTGVGGFRSFENVVRRLVFFRKVPSCRVVIFVIIAPKIVLKEVLGASVDGAQTPQTPL